MTKIFDGDGIEAMTDEVYDGNYKNLAENLTSVTVLFSRKLGNILVSREVKALRGDESGEIYLSRDDALLLEEYISVFNKKNIGLVVSQTIPGFYFSELDITSDSDVLGNPSSSTGMLTQVMATVGTAP